MFPITRIYSDDNGDSHFEKVEIPLQDAGTIGNLSAPLPAGNIIFREVVESYDYTYHTAPHKQYILLLDGGIEIETSLGDKRIFHAGEVLLVEDVTGKGHRSKNLLPAKRRSVFITIEPI